jgi:hypothetical protein
VEGRGLQDASLGKIETLGTREFRQVDLLRRHDGYRRQPTPDAGVAGLGC